MPFLTLLIENIQNRFKNKSILAAFEIFNPKKLSSDSDLLAEHGNTDIETLATQYQGVVASVEACQEEWSSYRQFLKETTHLTKHREVIQDLCTNATTATLFPNMSQLAKICQVIPIHTADVERTFSQLKLIKTRTRNRMSEKTPDSLLRIAVEGP